jgi:transposase
MLARLHRSGDLTPVYVPMAEDEAIRDLTRAREDAKSDEKRSKQRLLSFLLRSGSDIRVRSPWSKAHIRWLSDIKMPHPIPTGRLARVYRHRESMQRTRPTVNRTDPTTSARMATVSHRSGTSEYARRFNDRGRHNRCRNRRSETVPTPSELMSYLGLVPSEHSSGPR